jgi:uncharacterized protein
MRANTGGSERSPRPTRRQLLRAMSLTGFGSTIPRSLQHAATQLAAEPTQRVFTDRAPLSPAAFTRLPLGSIQPRGWLLQQLRIQATGLSGHIGEVWPDLGPNSGWLGGSGESWERGPYYLDGLLPLAFLVNDAQLKSIAHNFADWILANPWPDGMLGPRKNDDWWPRIVALKTLTQYEELTGDARVIPAMDRYFRYQLSALPQRPLRDWAKFRWQDEVLSVIWLYNRTGSPYLLELARLLHQQGFDWIASFDNFQYKEKITSEFLQLSQGHGLDDPALATHGVNNGQALKCGPVWSQITGNGQDRSAAFRMLEQLDRYHGLPNGMFSCDEHLAGRNPSQGSELCTVVELMFSLEQCIAITGDSYFADRLERLAFNALPGAITDDMWAHQYNQQPNQIECSLHHKPWVSDGPESNLFGLAPNFGCCAANFHQGWPKFTNSLWMLSRSSEQSEPDGLTVVAYAPCEVQTRIAGVNLRVVEDTDYPFRGKVRLTLFPSQPVSFPLRVRIPGWADNTSVRVNGKSIAPISPKSFVAIERRWKPGDLVEIEFPSQLRTSRWFNDSVAIERGPLVFSYGIGEDWVKLRQYALKSADWQIYPATPWNYALSVEADKPESSIRAVENEVTPHPFTARATPVHLIAKGRQVPDWRAEDGAANPVPQSPVLSDQPEESIKLIPYAAAKLRVTAFPVLKESAQS